MRNFRPAIVFVFLVFLFVLAGPPLFSADDQRRQAPSPPVRVDIPKPAAQVQRELQDILQIQQTLQLRQATQLREIQKITEQAKIHQRLLNNLTTPPSVSPPQRDLEEVLRLQKIALIQKQVQENRAILEGFQREVGGGGGIASVEGGGGKEFKEKKPKEKKLSSVGPQRAPFQWPTFSFGKPAPSPTSSDPTLPSEPVKTASLPEKKEGEEILTRSALVLESIEEPADVSPPKRPAPVEKSISPELQKKKGPWWWKPKE